MKRFSQRTVIYKTNDTELVVKIELLDYVSELVLLTTGMEYHKICGS